MRVGVRCVCRAIIKRERQQQQEVQLKKKVVSNEYISALTTSTHLVKLALLFCAELAAE
jgi:hypothetical protein